MDSRIRWPARWRPSPTGRAGSSTGTPRARRSWTSRLLDGRGEDLLHQEGSAAARGRLELAPAVRPDGMGDAAVRDEPLVVALLVAVVDRLAGKDPVAVVLVGAGRAHAGVGRAPAQPAVLRLRKVVVGRVAKARGVVAGVVEGRVHVAGPGIHRHPVVETVRQGGQP